MEIIYNAPGESDAFGESLILTGINHPVFGDQYIEIPVHINDAKDFSHTMGFLDYIKKLIEKDLSGE
jgi:hypothetical protein